MSFKYVTVEETGQHDILWTCDTAYCPSWDVVADNGDRVINLRPHDWSSVLVTSLSDGDYGYVLCQECTIQLHERFRQDIDIPSNLQAVGY